MTTSNSAAPIRTAAVGLNPKIVVRSTVVDRGSADPPSLFEVSGTTVVVEDEDEEPAAPGLAGLDGLDAWLPESAFESDALGDGVASLLSAGAAGLASGVVDGLLLCWADTPATVAIRNRTLKSMMTRRFMSHLLGVQDEQGWCRQAAAAQGARG